MTSRLTVALVALTAACALHRAPVVRSTPLPRAVHVGVNDGFQRPLPSDIAAHYADYGGDVTVRTPQLSHAALNTFLLSVAGLPIRTVALIEAPDAVLARQFATFVSLAAIENGNELELTPHELTPDRYAAVQAQMAGAEREAGFTGDIIMGGVYALTDATRQAITLALAGCAGCLVGVHLYDPSDADLAWLNTLDADIAVTETGSPTGCGMSRWQEQADYVDAVRARLAGVRRLKYFLVYQRPSGPPLDCTDLGTFGLQGWIWHATPSDPTSLGQWVSAWKPLDALLGQWVRH